LVGRRKEKTEGRKYLENREGRETVQKICNKEEAELEV
jgi:hypothetical protein